MSEQQKKEPDKKAKRSLSKRERTLLNFLIAAAVVFAGAYFIFIPLFRNRAQVTADLEAARTRSQQVTSQVRSIGAMTENVNALQAELDEARRNVPTFSRVENIEGEFTQAMLDLSIKPESVNIVKDEAGEEEDETELGWYTVNISASGSVESLMSLVDYINSEYNYRLSRLEITGDSPAKGTFVVKAALRSEAAE